MTTVQNTRTGGGVVALMAAVLVVVGCDGQTPLERLEQELEQFQEYSVTLQDMRADLSSSVRLFENNALGNAYQGVLDMTDANPPMASVLPTIDSTGIFRQEAAHAR